MKFKTLFKGLIIFFLIIVVLDTIQDGSFNFSFLFFLLLIAAVFPIGRWGYNKYKERDLLKKMSKSGIKDVDRMDGHQFEAYLKGLFKELGYKSDVTSGTRDFGADLVMKNDKKKVVIQAKRYGYSNKVSIGAIQEIYAAMPYYKAQQGIVITNSYYTTAAEELAKACNIRILDRKGLIYFINQVNPDFEAKDIQASVPADSRQCPQCGHAMQQRQNHSGQYFMGCSNYPDCKHTESVAQ